VKSVQKNKEIHYFGSKYETPVIVPLTAGPLKMQFADGNLRYIKLGDKEILRSIYVAIRDRNWGTVKNSINSVEIERNENNFSISYKVENRNQEIDFMWIGKIKGETDGTISFSMEGRARKDFYKTRIGFCILYPLKCAGVPCKYDEKVKSKDLKSFSHRITPGLWARLDFTGDIFEMEDQRNWTDASYKIYCTPLTLPYPVKVMENQEIKQSVKISLEVSPEFFNYNKNKDRLVINIGQLTRKKLCKFGFCINDYLEEDYYQLKIQDVEKLSPLHLRLDIDLDQEWGFRLIKGAAVADRLGTPLWLAVKMSSEVPDDFINALQKLPGKTERILLSKNCPPWNTSSEMANTFKNKLNATGLKILVGGGTDAFFAELNRNRPPVEELDFVYWSINPQVHTFDNNSLMESLVCQEETVKSATVFAGGCPLVVSPVTLKMRFNPHITGSERVDTINPPDIMKYADSRQWGLFGAVWTLISLKYLSRGGIEAASYYETLGPRGLINNSHVTGQPAFNSDKEATYYPVFQIFKEIAFLQGNGLYSVTTSEPLKVDGLSIRTPEGRVIYIANLGPVKRDVTIKGLFKDSQKLNASLFSEDQWEDIVSDIHYCFRDTDLKADNLGRTRIILPSYSVIRITENR